VGSSSGGCRSGSGWGCRVNFDKSLDVSSLSFVLQFLCPASVACSEVPALPFSGAGSDGRTVDPSSLSTQALVLPLWLLPDVDLPVDTGSGTTVSVRRPTATHFAPSPSTHAIAPVCACRPAAPPSLCTRRRSRLWLHVFSLPPLLCSRRQRRLRRGVILFATPSPFTPLTQALAPLIFCLWSLLRCRCSQD
jgi:hypothetical protein